MLVKNLFFVVKMDHREREGVEKSKEDRRKERRRKKKMGETTGDIVQT